MPDDKDMLMRKLDIYESRWRNILYLMLESLSISDKIGRNDMLF